MINFENLGLSERSLKALKQKGFEEPTTIQEMIIPLVLSGNKDIVGQAQTGTGKTTAFGLPIIELLHENSNVVQTLVLTPTRELAIQVSEEMNSLKGDRKLSIVPIYGGQSMERQLRSLRKGIDIVVGTPGRILDHLKRHSLKIDKISYLILDEADEMLDMGFFEDVSEIIEYSGQEKRTMLFSATIPEKVVQIAKKYMGEYDVLRANKEKITVSLTDQIYFEVSATDKFEALCRIIDIEDEFYGLIFCRTKIDVDFIANRLIERSYDANALHGDMSQSQREIILNKFKKHSFNILVATDVAARGLDVQNLTHVINYSLPQDPKSYIHRIGRTGRAGKGGNAITFVTPDEYRKLQFIKSRAKTNIRRAKLPRVKDVIETKKLKIKTDLENIVKSQLHNKYIAMSKKLSENINPEDIIAALLQYSFHDKLDEKSYVKIEDTPVDSKGKTRLFVTQGKMDGLTHNKLVNIIKDKCGTSNVIIRDVRILEKFSFVTLPFHEAEVLLSFFKKRKRGSNLFITKAKSNKSEHKRDRKKMFKRFKK